MLGREDNPLDSTEYTSMILCNCFFCILNFMSCFVLQLLDRSVFKNNKAKHGEIIEIGSVQCNAAYVGADWKALHKSSVLLQVIHSLPLLLQPHFWK